MVWYRIKKLGGEARTLCTPLTIHSVVQDQETGGRGEEHCAVCTPLTIHGVVQDQEAGGRGEEHRELGPVLHPRGGAQFFPVPSQGYINYFKIF